MDERYFKKTKGHDEKTPKELLQNGDWCTLRYGTVMQYIVTCDYTLFAGEKGWMSLDDYYDDLKAKHKDDCDIMEIRRPTIRYHFISKYYKDAPIIFKREEPKEMTIAEIEKGLGYAVKIVKEK